MSACASSTILHLDTDACDPTHLSSSSTGVDRVPAVRGNLSSFKSEPTVPSAAGLITSALTVDFNTVDPTMRKRGTGGSSSTVEDPTPQQPHRDVIDKTAAEVGNGASSSDAPASGPQACDHKHNHTHSHSSSEGSHDDHGHDAHEATADDFWSWDHHHPYTQYVYHCIALMYLCALCSIHTIVC